jgi:hypothetical protein
MMIPGGDRKMLNWLTEIVIYNIYVNNKSEFVG